MPQFMTHLEQKLLSGAFNPKDWKKTSKPQPPQSADKKQRIKDQAKARREKLKEENRQAAMIVLRHRAEDVKFRTRYSPDAWIGEFLDQITHRQKVMLECDGELGRGSRRHHILKLAKPAWANQAEIDEIYAERDRLNADVASDPFQVDHIYPILGKDVCGLHVAENLRIIRSSENLFKSNRHPDSLSV
jgi:hypothetical protein